MCNDINSVIKIVERYDILSDMQYTWITVSVYKHFCSDDTIPIQYSTSNGVQVFNVFYILLTDIMSFHR